MREEIKHGMSIRLVLKYLLLGVEWLLYLLIAVDAPMVLVAFIGAVILFADNDYNKFEYLGTAFINNSILLILILLSMLLRRLRKRLNFLSAENKSLQQIPEETPS